MSGRRKRSLVSVWWRSGDQPRPVTRGLLFGLPAALAAAVLSVPANPAVAAPVQGKPGKPVCPAELPDEHAALVTARICGGPVPISGLTTETDDAVATPGGAVKLSHRFRPVRVRQDGRWVPVDTSLAVTADGQVAPKATATGVVFSGGGTGPMITVSTGGKTLTVGSPVGALPTPQLDAATPDTATYPEVLPGVDLQLRADVDGFAEVLVVKTRQAADNPKLAALHFQLAGKGLTSTADKGGNLRVTDAKGHLLLAGNTPLMWDAAAQDTPAAGLNKTPARSTGRHATMQTTVAGGTITVIPDTKILQDPATVYPVYLDPGVTANRSTWAQIDSGTPTTAYWNGSGDAQVGTPNGGTNLWRSYFTLDLSSTPVAGTYISAATLNLTETWSASCTATGMDLYATGAISSATTWNNQPTVGNWQSYVTAAKGYSSSCPSGSVSMDATDAVRTAAASSASTVTLGLAADNEADSGAFKKFSNNPTLSITYTGYPTVGDRSTAPSTPCVTGSGRPYINTATPLLQARVTDPESSSVQAQFAWSTTGGTAIGSSQPAAKASGSLFGVSVPSGAFSDGSSYSWKVQGFDGIVWSAWSASCEFTVDTVAPTAAPTVSSTTYPSGSWAGATGTAGTFTLGASGVSDVASYLYGVDTTPNTSITAATLGGTASLSLTPASDGPHTLKVQSQDRAGNLSPITTYAFNVGIGAVLSPHVGTISAGKVTLQALGMPTTTGVTFWWRRGDNDTWTSIPAADVVLASGGTAITWPVATTGSGAYPNLVWSVDQTVNNAEAGPDPLDGPIQVRASFTGASGSSSAVKFAFDRAAASAATEDVGPGPVNLLTGNLAFSNTDVSIDAYGSDLTVTRTFNTRRYNVPDPGNMFGPGWSSAALVDTADAPYTSLTVTGSLVQVGLPDGNTLGFTASSSTVFVPELGMENLQLTYDATNDVYTITDKTGVTVDFTHISGAPTGSYQPTTVTQPGSGQKTTIIWAKVTIGGVDLYRPTRVLAPVPSGVTCTTSLLAGCRALDFTYATATTTTGTGTGDWGDYLGRLKEITFTAWDPDLATPAMRTVAVADYAYDISGKLRSAWDPRLDYTDTAGSHHVAETYTYISDGLLSRITPAGQEPWYLTYTTIPGDSGEGRLASVSRSALTAGTATTTVVYHVPTDNTGPDDLSAGQTARWGQTDPPVDATAIYPATQVPDGNQATGVLPSSAERATIYYLNADGRQTNVADPSGHIDTDWYDQYGNTVRHLDGGNLEEALNASSTDTTAQEAALALRYSTINTYNSDGQQLLDTLGPEHDTVLPDWSSVKGRTHTHNTYDQGAPSGGPYNLVTTSTTTVRYTVNGVDTDTDARTTTTDYNWTLRKPITSTVDPSGLNLVTRTAYDSTTGLVTSTTAPEGGTSTTTPATRTTVYYRASYGSGYTECDYRPEWANLPCRVQPGGQPGTGAELPVTVTTYDIYNQPRVVTEKNSTTTLRTTTTTYDTAGRPYDTTITTASGLGTSLPTTRRTYDQATGQLLKTQSVVSGSVTAEISRGYDTLGRLSSYTDAGGVTSTTTYDILGRIATTDDGKATRTYTYDGGTERRGLLTQVDDTQAGTFTASYDGRGKIAHQTWPTGVTTNQYYDETGEATGIEYLTNSSCTTSSCTLYTNYIGQDAHGLNRWDSNTLDSYGYTYDNAGRLVDAAHTTTAGCILREYTYDTATNRTKLTRYANCCRRTRERVQPRTDERVQLDGVSSRLMFACG